MTISNHLPTTLLLVVLIILNQLHAISSTLSDATQTTAPVSIISNFATSIHSPQAVYNLYAFPTPSPQLSDIDSDRIKQIKLVSNFPNLQPGAVQISWSYFNRNSNQLVWAEIDHPIIEQVHLIWMNCKTSFVDIEFIITVNDPSNFYIETEPGEYEWVTTEVTGYNINDEPLFTDKFSWDRYKIPEQFNPQTNHGCVGNACLQPPAMITINKPHHTLTNNHCLIPQLSQKLVKNGSMVVGCPPGTSTQSGIQEFPTHIDYFPFYPLLHDITFPTIALQQLPLYPYPYPNDSDYPSSHELFYTSLADIPEYHFRINFNVMQQVAKGEKNEYWFELLQQGSYEFVTIHEPLERRQNVQHPVKYVKHPLYEIHPPYQTRSAEEQKLMESDDPFCVLNTVVPFPVTLHTPSMFSIQFDLWDDNQPFELNREAQKLLSFSCYNFAIKTKYPTGFNTHQNSSTRTVQIIVHQIVAFSQVRIEHAWNDEDNPTDPSPVWPIFVSNQLLFLNPFGANNSGQNHVNPAELSAERADKNSSLSPPLTTTPSSLNPQSGLESYTQTLVTPSSFQCTNQIGFNSDLFIRCVVADQNGEIFRNIRNLRLFVYNFLPSATSPTLTDSRFAYESPYLVARQLNPNYGKTPAKQNNWAPFIKMIEDEHFNKDSFSSTVPVLMRGYCETVTTDELLWSCSRQEWIDPESQFARIPYAPYDPSAPVIVDIWLERVKSDASSMIDLVSSQLPPYPRILLGISKTPRTPLPHRKTILPSLLLPISYRADYITTTNSTIEWDQAGNFPAPSNQLSWAYNILTSPTVNSTTISFPFNVRFSDGKPSHDRTFSYDTVFLHFPSRNFIFLTKAAPKCTLAVSSKDTLDPTVKSISNVTFGQFPDQISSNHTQAVQFNPLADKPHLPSPIVDPTIADILILKEFDTTIDLELHTTEITCTVAITTNPVYHPPEEVYLHTEGFTSLVLRSTYTSDQCGTADRIGDQCFVTSQVVKSFTFIEIEPPAERLAVWVAILIVISSVTLFMLIIVLVSFFSTRLQAFLLRIVKRCFPCCLPPDRRQAEVNAILKAQLNQPSQPTSVMMNLEDNMDDGELARLSERVQRQIEKRRANALIGAQNVTTMGSVDNNDVESAHAGTVSAKKKWQYEDQDAVKSILSNRVGGRHNPNPLANELDSSGAVRKKRSVYQ